MVRHRGQKAKAGGCAHQRISFHWSAIALTGKCSRVLSTIPRGFPATSDSAFQTGSGWKPMSKFPTGAFRPALRCFVALAMDVR